MSKEIVLPVKETDIQEAVIKMGQFSDSDVVRYFPLALRAAVKNRLCAEETVANIELYDFSNWTDGGLRGGER